jgi:hypothetical protein
MSKPQILWTSGSNNEKTGNCLTGWVGSTVEETELSCKGCPQLGGDNKKTTCYAHGSMVKAGLINIQKTFKTDPSRYTIDNALKKRSRDTKAARFSSIGDPGRLGLKILRPLINKLRKAGLAILNYTHHWRELNPNKYKGIFLASCDSIEEADKAVSLGWRATAIVPYDWADKYCLTPSGSRAIVCPAIWGKRIGLPANKLTTCNECRLCDPINQKAPPVILFIDHSPAVRVKAKRLREATKLPLAE